MKEKNLIYCQAFSRATCIRTRV